MDFIKDKLKSFWGTKKGKTIVVSLVLGVVGVVNPTAVDAVVTLLSVFG
jgi:predicted negative regulator of RcsB-dependent stress response